jgi:chorismate mutase
MTTVQQRSESLRAGLNRHHELQRGHDAAEAIRNRVGELKLLREAIASALAKADVLRANSFAVEKTPLPTKASEALAACVIQGTAAATDAGREFGRLKRALDKARDGLEAIVANALDDLRRSIPTVDEALLKQIEHVPGCADQVARIRQERAGLLGGKDLNVLSAEDLRKFLEQCHAVRTLADGLDVADFPKEVLEFFKAVRKGGAPLDKFTDVVRDWLKQRDQLRHVRITVVST